MYNICGDELDAFVDHAALTFPLPRMTTNGVITDDSSEMWIDGSNVWIYPFGWNVKGTSGFSEPYGYFATGTSQEFTIDCLGTVGVRKLGHSVSREVSGAIHLDSDGGTVDD